MAGAAPAEHELEGLTEEDCADGCTAECCVITGRRFVKFEDGSEGFTTHCCHPAKGGVPAAYATNRDVLKRFAAAKKYLAVSSAARKDYNQ